MYKLHAVYLDGTTESTTDPMLFAVSRESLYPGGRLSHLGYAFLLGMSLAGKDVCVGFFCLVVLIFLVSLNRSIWSAASI